MKAFRGSILHCLGDPGEGSDPAAWEYFDDGLLVVKDGCVESVGGAAELADSMSGQVEITDYRGKLTVPGLIDCHVHFPQLDIIGSFGAQLLDWLNQYAYPAEERFADAAYAREVATAFIGELLRLLGDPAECARLGEQAGQFAEDYNKQCLSELSSVLREHAAPATIE